mgnify:CR=1 FL=1
MRLLLTTYHQAFLTHGGGETELRQLAELINDLGVRADIYGPSSKRLSFYDAVIHFSAHGGGEQLLAEVKAAGTPVILLPNFNFFDLQHTARGVVQRHLDLADLVILRTEQERALCVEHFAIAQERTAVVPAGISAAFGRPVEENLFKSAYGLEQFILWVGQIEEGKQQLRAIEALQDGDTPLVFIGGHRDKAYYDRCRAAAGENVRFLPYVQPNSEILRSAVQSCDAYIELGLDYPGFSSLEVALAGRPMVLNDHPWSREVLGNAPVYVENDTPQAIRAAMKQALAGKGAGELVERMKALHVQPKPTQQLLELVEELCKGRK